MANIKSSAKRVLVSRAQAARNKADKSELKTTIKKFSTALAEGNQENAEAAPYLVLLPCHGFAVHFWGISRSVPPM